MTALWLSMASLWMTARAAPATMDLPAPQGAMLVAADMELERALTMQLPGQPRPYYVAYEFLDGDVATATARSGILDSFDHAPYRSVRVEVRVGSYDLDNSRYDGDFGEREGVSMRTLPDDPFPAVALRREIWLATDEAYKGAAEQYSGKAAAREGRPPPDDPLPSFQQIEPVTTVALTAAPVDADSQGGRQLFMQRAVPRPHRYLRTMPPTRAEGMRVGGHGGAK